LAPPAVTVRRFSHIVGFDDGPFLRRHRGDVRVVGAVFAGQRLDGVLSDKVRRDGRNATRVVARLVRDRRFAPHLQLIMLQGIAFAGFNVVDIHALAGETGLPVLVVARKKPNLTAIKRALLGRVPGGLRKWDLIEKAGPMERAGTVWVQRAGLSARAAHQILAVSAVHGKLPEPLRVAHLIAGGLGAGQSRGRA
jgi:endonuclease V-like protein UPF0215 family